MTKITQQEFKKWGEELKQIYTELAKNSQFESEAATKEFIETGVLVWQYTERGVIQATFLGMAHLESIRIDWDSPLSALSGLTFKEWEEKVYNRIKEHCIANGFYNPASPPDLALLKERKKKAGQLLKNKEENAKILAYADSEDYKIMAVTCLYFEDMENISPSSQEDSGDIPRGFDFMVEDWVGRTEKLISKKEQAEKKDKPSSPTNNSPNSPTPKPSTEYKNNLEAEIKRLQDQISELEDKVNKTDNTTQKETYQKILDNTKKGLGDKKKEKDKLSNLEPKSTSSNNNSNKLNWAIGLGIAAVVLVIFFGVILLLNQKKKKKNSKI